MKRSEIVEVIQMAAREQLTALHLSAREMDDLPPEITSVKGLKSLNLSRNKLDEFPRSLFEMPSLQDVDLNINKLTVLPEDIDKLKQLRRLRLRNNLLTALPPSMAHMRKLKFLDLHENPMSNIPPEVLDEVDRPQRIIDYFLELQRGGTSQRLNEVKMIVVGQGGVGKTSLVKRLVEDKYDAHENKTQGICISRWPIPSKNDSVRVNIWDFGGQEIMHSTHQFFLTKRSLYVLVLDGRQGEHESRLEYWLKMIDSFGDNSPTIVVINKSDQHKLDLNRRGLKAKYPFLKTFHDISCCTRLGIDELRADLQSQLLTLPHVSDLLPESWFAVKERLREMNRDFVSYDSYREICRACDIPDDFSQDSLAELLHDLGIVINFRDDHRLCDTNVLNPAWVTNGVYTIINSAAMFKSEGVLDLSTLDQILPSTRYPKEKHAYIVSLMEKFELCFEFADTHDSRFLLPELLRKEQPDLNWPEHESLRFQYHYDVLPSSVMSRFIVRMSHLISKKTYWYGGVVLADGNNKALVRSDEEDGIIYVSVIGNSATRRGFLQSIRSTIEAVTGTVPRLECHAKVPYLRYLLDYQHLLTLEKLGAEDVVPEGHDKRVSVSELLDGVDERGTSDEDKIARKKTRMRILREQLEMNDNVTVPTPDHQYSVHAWEKIVAAVAAGAALVVALYLIVRNEPFRDPNLVVLSRILIATCVAAFGATIPGFLRVGIDAKGLSIRAAGAFALFVLSYLFTPNVLPQEAIASTPIKTTEHAVESVPQVKSPSGGQ